MPAQWAAERRFTGGDPVGGERRLAVAVIVQALKDVGMEGMVGRETRRWFVAKRGGWPYGFEALCEAIGLEPDAIRSRVVAEWGDGWEKRVAQAGLGIRSRQPLGWTGRRHRRMVSRGAYRLRCR